MTRKGGRDGFFLRPSGDARLEEFAEEAFQRLRELIDRTTEPDSVSEVESPSGGELAEPEATRDTR